MITDAQLREMEARAAAATPAPWENGSWGDNVFSVRSDPAGEETWTEICRIKRDSKPVEESQDGRDARFIAHARADVPTLIAEVRLARKLAIAAIDITDWVHHQVYAGEPVDRARLLADRTDDLVVQELGAPGDGFTQLPFTVALEPAYVTCDGKRVAEGGLQGGDQVLCRVITGGEVLAQVTEVEKDSAIAETPGLFLMLHLERGYWCCNNSYNREVTRFFAKLEDKLSR